MAVAIVGGAIANKPRSGGEAWVRLSWLLGLRRLGFDVHLVELLAASACVDERGRASPFAESVNRAHFEHVVQRFGLSERATLLDHSGRTLHGLHADALADVGAAAEVLFDLSGHLGGLAAAALPRQRVYVDLDPGFTQAWHEDPALAFTLAGYDRHVTVGLNVGRPGCAVPTAGLDWIATPPPVVLERWPPAAPPQPPHRFTTVASWRSPFGAIALDGRTLGLKHHEFRRLIDLPERVREAEFELALDIDPADEADRRALLAHGWSVVDAQGLAASPDDFRAYVRASSAEISVAQPAYVETRSGWFSDRTAAYLASGRPALVQDTGIESLPLGEGLLTFSTPREAAAGARAIAADHAAHAAAARAFAERHLDSDVVLATLLDALRVGR